MTRTEHTEEAGTNGYGESYHYGVKAFTVRNVPPKLAGILKRNATMAGTSLNKTVIRLLQETVGESKPAKTTAHHDLDFLIGTWSRSEADAFDRRLAEQRKIEPGLWR